MHTLYLFLADLAVVIHLLFIAFVVLGGLLVLKWPPAAWLHLPALAWGVYIELSGGICPLTPLEVWLRRQAGSEAYAGGFVEHYLLPILYPPGLTPGVQQALAAALITVNVLVYGWVLYRRRRR